MPHLVTNGATLRCSMGTMDTQLQILPNGVLTASGIPVARITDTLKNTNIKPFGDCRSTRHPLKTPFMAQPPCDPNIVGPWVPGSSSVRSGNVPLLHQTCQCTCQIGGIVSILTPGQLLTTVG